MMHRLERTQLFEAYPEDKELLDDVFVETLQATNDKISGDILSQMMDAFASIISNNLNDVMKILAVATIILSIPTVLASLYGMNVLLPVRRRPGRSPSLSAHPSRCRRPLCTPFGSATGCERV